GRPRSGRGGGVGQQKEPSERRAEGDGQLPWDLDKLQRGQPRTPPPPALVRAGPAGGVARASGWLAITWITGAGISDHEVGRAVLPLAQQPQDVGGRAHVADCYRGGRVPEGSRNRLGGPVDDGDHLRQRP